MRVLLCLRRQATACIRLRDFRFDFASNEQVDSTVLSPSLLLLEGERRA